MPVPKGYTLDAPHPQLPAGYTLDAPMAVNPYKAPVVAGLPEGVSLPGVPGAPTPAGLQGPPTPIKPPSTLDTVGEGVANLGKGIVKGAGSTFLNLSQMGNSAREAEHKYLPYVSPTLPGQTSDESNRAYVQNLQDQTQANGTMQKIGKGAEQIGEFLIPGAAEEAGSAKLATLAPKLGKYALPTAKLTTAALSSGTVNKAQGGSFAGGAAAGALGSAAGSAIKAVAPMIAESALGVRSLDRNYGRTPGQAILDETNGINPGKIAQAAQGKLDLYTGELQQAAKASPNAVSLFPAQQIAKDAQATALSQNSPDLIKRTGQLADQLIYDQKLGGKPTNASLFPKIVTGFGPTAPVVAPKVSNLLPPSVDASRAIDLKRGIGATKNSWTPTAKGDFVDGVIGNLYGALDSGIDASFPGSKGLNQKISTLIPVAERAHATDLNASALQRALGRFTRPTGALVGGAAGGTYGYKEGGIPGAIAGFGAGVLAPELIGSPTFQMGIARTANSALIPPTVKALTGAGLQIARKKNLYGND